MSIEEYRQIRQLRNNLRQQVQQAKRADGSLLMEELAKAEAGLQKLLKNMNQQLDMMHKLQTKQALINDRLIENSGTPSLNINKEDTEVWAQTVKGSLGILGEAAQIGEEPVLPVIENVEKIETAQADLIDGRIRLDMVKNLKNLASVVGTVAMAGDAEDNMEDTTVNTILSDDVSASSPLL